MIRRRPRSTRTDTLLPYTTLFRSTARALSTRRSRIVGVIMGYLDNGFYPAVLEALSAELHAIDYRILLRSEEHTSELQSLMRISYAVFCLKKKKQNNKTLNTKM